MTLSSLVHSCGRHGLLDKAFSLYEAMRRSPNPADRYSLQRVLLLLVITCGASLNACSSSRRPNSITCSSLVDSCLKADDVDRAFLVLRHMRREGIPLTEVTYTSLISELTRLKELDRIVEVIVSAPGMTIDSFYIARLLVIAYCLLRGPICIRFP